MCPQPGLGHLNVDDSALQSLSTNISDPVLLQFLVIRGKAFSSFLAIFSRRFVLVPASGSPSSSSIVLANSLNSSSSNGIRYISSSSLGYFWITSFDKK